MTEATAKPASAPRSAATRWHVLASVGCALAGLLLAIVPSLFAGRFPEELSAGLAVGRGIGLALTAVGTGAALWRWMERDNARLALQCGIGACAYVPLTLVFGDWHIDDAAITYAYSDNLARGHGLVLLAGEPPEEAYSNPIWMLLLAGAGWLGIDVALAAKVLSTVVGIVLVMLVFSTSRRICGRALTGPSFAVTLAALLSAPFLIWSISGLEHGLQALMLVAFVWAGTRPMQLTIICTLVGCGLVLLRPEAPLVIAMLCAGLAMQRWRSERDLRAVLNLWPIACIPALTLLALLTFRWFYFGDLLPNPYYAKAAGSASFLGLLNPYGPGWRYVVQWLSTGAGFVLLVPLAFYRWRELPLAVLIAVWVFAGQVAFVIYAGGDWMAYWRFLAAPLSLLALLAGYGVERFMSATSGLPSRFAWLAACALWLCNAPLLVHFRAAPATPCSVVTEVGNTFVALAKRLHIEQPLLAHHDAGGTSYRAQIRLLDLGGLGSRSIAKRRDDREFLRSYILEERKPDFIFGTARYFAAGAAQITEAPLFIRDYVRILFPRVHAMKAELCHIRRDKLREVAGVTLQRHSDGTEVAVVDAIQ